MLEQRNHSQGDIKAASFSLLGEGQQVIGVLAAFGADRTVGTDAGFIDLGQRAFEGGPKGKKFFKELLFKGGTIHFVLHRVNIAWLCMHIILYAYNT